MTSHQEPIPLPTGINISSHQRNREAMLIRLLEENGLGDLLTRKSLERLAAVLTQQLDLVEQKLREIASEDYDPA